MKRSDRPPLSLGIRLSILVFLVEALLLGAFAASVYLLSKSRFYASFDSILEANAEAIGTLVDDEGGELELEFADEIMARFSRQELPDLFAVIHEDGRVVEKSRSMEGMPEVNPEQAGSSSIRSFEHDGHTYRGILLPIVRNSEEHPGRKIRIRVFFAANTGDLQDQLNSLAEILGWFIVLGLVISVLLAGFVAWHGLSPLRRLARETQAIKGESLDRRLRTGRLPREVLRLAEAINGLLGRVEAVLAQERRFSSDAAHELRTPVATLKSGIQAALLEPPDTRGDRRVLEDLLKDVVRLEDLCSDLLLVASNQANLNHSDLLAEDWSLAIEEVARGFDPGPGSSEGGIHLSRPETLPEERILRTNRACTRRIAANLIENALRHGGPGVRIVVEVSFPGPGAQLVVQDDGPGIAPEDRPRLFERFFRADQARSRATGGAGLGLAICQSIASTQGGTIRFEAVAPRGSRFIWSVTGKE